MNNELIYFLVMFTLVNYAITALMIKVAKNNFVMTDKMREFSTERALFGMCLMEIIGIGALVLDSFN